MEVRDIDALEQWWRPGALPRWAAAALALATVVTVAVAHVGAHHLAWYLEVDGFWIRDGLALALATAAALAWLPRCRIARSARVAIALPAAQLAAIAVGWAIWCALRANMGHKLQIGPLVRALPLHVIAPIYAAATVLVARAIAGKRRGEWLHATVMLALVHALLAGVWVSIAAQLWCRGHHHEYFSWADVHAMLTSRLLVVIVLAPPFAAASAFTLLAIRHFERVRRRGLALAAVAVVGVVYATLLRLDPKPDSNILYVNFVHVLLALVVVAAGALGALAFALRRRPEAAQLRGVVTADGERGAPVMCLQIAGWLRGPRVVAQPFSVVTREGAVAVPADARVSADLPAHSTHLASGEAIAIVREGDRVALSGYVTPPSDHPFRTSLVPMPGPRVTVHPETAEPRDLAAVALALWRPCVAYLAVIVAIALPGLCAALAAR